MCIQVYSVLESVPSPVSTLAPAPAPGLGSYAAAAPSVGILSSTSAASPAAIPVASPGVASASDTDDTASGATPSQGTAGQPSDSNVASPQAGPAMAPAVPPAGSPVPSSAADMYQVLIQSYMASLAPSPAVISEASPAAAPTSSDDTSAAPAVSQAPSAQEVSLKDDAASSPAAAPAPGEDALGSPAASPDPGRTATSLNTDLALPPLPSLNAPSSAAPPAGGTLLLATIPCMRTLMLHHHSNMSVKPVRVLKAVDCTADALVQACQDMYSTYVNVISAQTSMILSKNVLQPQQLTESYLAGISGKYMLPFIKQAKRDTIISICKVRRAALLTLTEAEVIYPVLQHKHAYHIWKQSAYGLKQDYP